MERMHETMALDYLGEILQTAKSSNQYEQTLHLIVDRIVRLYRPQTCAVILIDPTTEYLNVENSIGLSYTFCKEFRRKLAVGLIGEVLWTGKPIVIADRSKEPQRAAELQLEQPFESCVCVQIGVDNRSLGYLHVDSRHPNAFSRRDVCIMQIFADLAALAIHKARLHDENLHLDTIDHDTGLEKYNAFIRRLETELAGAASFGENVSVMILDVDNYKTILGTYGYENALQCLKELGALVRAELRSIDACGRYGFDEFIVMLSRTNLDSAVQFAQKLCRAVEASRFVGGTIRTTVSIGLATFPQNGQTLNDLLVTAKRALFEAQRAGRNNVFFYPAEWYAGEHACGDALTT